MKAKRLGCLSASGWVAVLVTLLVIGGVGLARGGVLYSPGELSAQTGEGTLGGARSHAGLAEQCQACHAPPLGTQKMADRCLACHRELFIDASSFHSMMVAQGQRGSCTQCHTDHNGPQAALTVIDIQRFPHNRIGFSLQAHRQKTDQSQFVCADCHGSLIRRVDQAVCLDCHTHLDAAFSQAHLLAYGENCLACHDGVDRYGRAFDHNRQVFSLQGRHQGVDCTGCHGVARSAADLKSTPQECAGCHLKDDPHNGTFGKDCGSCHIPDGWDQARFDHSKSAFPLVGRHVEVQCPACHINKVFKGTPTSCAACHGRQDPHQGRFGTDCAGCHNPQAWQDAKFDHALSAFHLKGKHTTVACQACHVNNVFKGTPSDCAGCHAKDDAHQGKFGAGCDGCHTPASWQGATFDHSKSAFPLSGAHLQLACTRCHVNNVFKGTSTQCAGCHKDPPMHAGLFGSDCQACHITAAWSPAKFNRPHAFPLNHGEGGASTCRTCHPSTLSAYTCYGCHVHDPARVQAQHAEQRNTNLDNCIACHPNGRAGD